MKRTINAEFEDINQACSFYNEAIKDTQKECDLTFKNSQPLIIITDKEKEEDKEKHKKENQIKRNYHFKGNYKQKGIPQKGHVVFDLSFIGGNKHRLDMNFNFDPTDPTDVSLGRIMSRIRNEMRAIFDIEYSGPDPSALF